MSAELFWNPQITVNSVDLSSRAKSAMLHRTKPPIEVTAFGDLAHTTLGGVEEWSLDVTFYQDYAAASVHRTLDALVGSAGFPIVFRKDKGAKTTSNPEYSGTAILTGYNPADGSFGNVETINITFRSAGDLTRATS